MKTLIFTVVVLTSFSVSGQKYTYIGPNLSFLNPYLSYNMDYDNYLDLGGAGYGLSIRRTFNDLLSFEIGIYNLYIGDFIEYRNTIRESVGSDDKTLIPLRAQISKYIFKDRISVYGYFGPEYLYNAGNGGGTTIHYFNDDRIIMERLTDEPHNILLGGGSGIRFKFIEEMTFSINLGFGKSFKQLRTYYVEYWIGENLESSWTTKSKGEYWGITLRLSYPFNKAIKDFRKAVEELKTSEF